MEKYELLSAIHSPDDVKKLPKRELPRLCAEIREKLVETVSKNGGHLASNLGVVELTVALHRVFDSPKDQIVWDVGHQCYAHKLLTGRCGSFSTLRKYGGLSGFTKPCESEHDPFGAGHSSTSISAATGLAKAKTLLGQDGTAIAVIGDGSLTGGLAYEGMNNAGRSRDRLIVILNDNTMSISKNVGAIARHLAVIRAKPAYFKIKDGVEAVVSHLPLIGGPLHNLIFRWKSLLKNALYHSTIFEEMGFAYLGPGDGHNIDEVCRLLRRAKELRRPALIHLMTVKGKGYTYAEQDPRAFHGVGNFDIETGEAASHGHDFSEAFGKELVSLAEKDARVCAVTAAMGGGTGLASFAARFRERYFDVGIAEQHAAVFSAGLARNGMRPVFAVYSSFLQRAYDQLIHDAALQKLKVVFAVDRAGLVGEDGETHQGIFDAAFLQSIPGMTVYSPSCFEELRIALRKALYESDGPAALRYPRGKEPPMPAGFLPDGAPFTLLGEPDADLLLVTYGRLFSSAWEAARLLRERNVRASVLKLTRIRPLDPGCTALAAGFPNVLFFEEGVRVGGVGEHFGSLLLEAGYSGGFRLRAIDDRFVRQGTVAQLLCELGLDTEGMVREALSLVRGGAAVPV